MSTTSARRPSTATSRGIGLPTLAVYLPFALAGAFAVLATGALANAAFAVLYALSGLATPWLLARLRQAVRSAPIGKYLWVPTAVFLVLGALGHMAEATLVAAQPTLTIAAADAGAGPFSASIQVAGTAGFLLGSLLFCVILWRARLVPIWPAILMVLVLPTGALPHGPAQQLTRTALVIAAATWIAIRTNAQAEGIA